MVIAVLLFAISTAISWSYYGDRCANYLLGPNAVLPYKIVFVIMHFVGAVLPLTTIWDLGDIFLAIVIVPNLIALVLLSPQVVRGDAELLPAQAVGRERRGPQGLEGEAAPGR